MSAILEARELNFAFREETRLIQDWSVTFSAGELTAIMGPSGRGKSTLMYLLGLMLKPQSGRVLVDGVEMQNLPDRLRASARASTYGFVFQDAALDPARSVLDNIVETAIYRVDDRKVAIAGALDLMEQLGVSLRRSARPGQVSGGQAQRIAMCRALLGKPRIILADEPTGNLDAAAATLVLRVLRAEAERGATVVIVTHDPAIANMCDRQILI